MNRHNGFVTCSRCKCVTRKKKTQEFSVRAQTYEWRTAGVQGDRIEFYCRDPIKCAVQAKIQTERDRRLHAALQAREERDVDRQMAFEMRGFMAGA